MKRKTKARKAKNSYQKLFLPAIVLVIVIGGLVLAKGGITNTATTTTINPQGRQQYCDSKGCIPDVVFVNLPNMPHDFKEIDLLVSFSQLPSMLNFSVQYPDSAYYLQPEFFPTWEESGINTYTPLKDGYKPAYIGIEGYGAYPGDLIIRGAVPGDTLRTTSFWHSSWGVATYQGTKVDRVFPANGETDGGAMVVNQDPELVAKYINVTVTPEVILMEPSFPFFQKGWVQPVRMEMQLSSDIPKGNYLVGLIPSELPRAIRGIWNREHRLQFVEVGGFLGVSRPTFQAFIVVE